MRTKQVKYINNIISEAANIHKACRNVKQNDFLGQNALKPEKSGHIYGALTPDKLNIGQHLEKRCCRFVLQKKRQACHLNLSIVCNSRSSISTFRALLSVSQKLSFIIIIIIKTSNNKACQSFTMGTKSLWVQQKSETCA